MKITKSRLLQIIREEVELHEKNTFELDENELQKEVEDPNSPLTTQEFETDKDGDLTKRSKQDALNKAISGNLEETDVEEDRLFGPKDSEGKRRIIQPEKNGRKIEIKIR